MAVTLSDNYGKINFVDSVAGYSHSINKSDIVDIIQIPSKNRILIKVKQGVLTSGHTFYFSVDDISTPVVYGLNHCYNTLVKWWKEPHLNYVIFISEDNQKVFNCSPRFKVNCDNYKVIIDGYMQNYGHSVINNSVVFEVGQSKYSEIIVQNR